MLLYSNIFTDVACRLNLSFLSFVEYSFNWFNLLCKRNIVEKRRLGNLHIILLQYKKYTREVYWSNQKGNKIPIIEL